MSDTPCNLASFFGPVANKRVPSGVKAARLAPQELPVLVQMNALMGFVSDALIATILGMGLPRDREVATLRAFNKLLWVQNDLITRHYQSS